MIPDVIQAVEDSRRTVGFLMSREPGPSEEPMGQTDPGPQQSPPPGWYKDPSGEYEQRYWDGSAWADNARTDNLFNRADPGWYRDPTGEHKWRYWDGSAWTDKARYGVFSGPGGLGIALGLAWIALILLGLIIFWLSG